MPSADVTVEALYLDLDLPTCCALDAALPYVATNTVCSIDGRVAVAGKANDIGGVADRRVMRNLRSLFDAVLRGGATLRAEKISAGVPETLAELRASRGLAEQPYEVILTGTGELPLRDNLLDSTPDRTIVVVPESALSNDTADRLGALAILVQLPAGPDGRVRIRQALRHLKDAYGIERLLAEGGPSLNHALVSSSVVQDVFQTIAPKFVAGPPSESPPMLAGDTLPQTPDQRAELRSAHLAQEELFLRYGLSEVVR